MLLEIHVPKNRHEILFLDQYHTCFKRMWELTLFPGGDFPGNSCFWPVLPKKHTFSALFASFLSENAQKGPFWPIFPSTKGKIFNGGPY